MMLNKNSIVVFDLDDTLYKEVDFLKSAYMYIARIIKKESGVDVFNEMLSLYYKGESTFDVIYEKYKTSLTIDQMVHEYRFHKPSISLSEMVLDTVKLLQNNDITLGIISDGRSKSQRNKLEALGIMESFGAIIISEELGTEKPNTNNYKSIERLYPDRNYFYIADNTSKDFIGPNSLGWTTICVLDDGRNIHKQEFNVKPEYLPNYCVKSFKELYEMFYLTLG